jgi:phage-related protein
VYYPAFGIDKKVEIVKTVWDPLGERYDTLELNSMKKSLYDTLTSMIQNQTKRR